MSLVGGRLTALPAHSRRAIALFVLPLLIAIGWLVIYLPIAYVAQAQGEWRDRARSVFAQARDATQLQATLDQELAKMRASALWSRFYTSDRSGASAASLQSDVGALLSNVQASTQSLTPIPSEELSDFTRIGTRLTASMRIDQLKSVLAAIAVHPRYLRIELLTIVAPQTQLAHENSHLAITMEVYAFERPTNPQQPEVNSTLALRGAN